MKLEKISPYNYPGRIYGVYVWDYNKNKWIVDDVFCKSYGIKNSTIIKRKEFINILLKKDSLN